MNHASRSRRVTATVTVAVTAIAIVAIAALMRWVVWPHAHVSPSPATTTTASSSVAAADYKTASYTIEGVPVALVNGYAATPVAPGSASMLVTRYFGNEAHGDLTGSGSDDVAFLLTQSGGGSGTFFYVVAALRTPDGYEGTNAVLLGDRIAPQTTEIRDGEIVVNYADRKPTDPMTARPSLGVTKYLRVVQGVLVEVAAPSSPSTSTPPSPSSSIPAPSS